MSLTKLFNKNYCIQNLKKSKGALATFLVLLPIFTAFFIVINGINAEKQFVQVFSLEAISAINLIAMYVIPLIISYCLFGFVFKKKSVDFINSLPMSRKTVFITNTITGILLILLEQFITAVLIFIATNVFSFIVVPVAEIIDMFLIFSLAYTFVFTATNLAMTVSGNFPTQIVVTMLIVFLLPFCATIMNGFSLQQNLIIEGVNCTGNINPSYVLPYNIIVCGMFDSNWFSNTSLLKMFLYTILYLVIGIKLFETRKMENSENSFANVHIHGLVKGLTLFPIISILYYVRKESDATAVIIILTLISLAYFFIYDLVTNKKVKLKYNIGYFILAVAIICYFNWMVEIGNESSRNVRKLSVDDIKEAYTFTYENYYVSSSIYQKNDLEKIKLSKDTVEKIFNTTGTNKTRIAIQIKLKSGEIINTNIPIEQKLFETINNQIEEEKSKEKLDLDNYVELSICDLKLDSKEQKELKQILKEEKTELNYNSDLTVELYYYKDFEIRKREISIENSKKIIEFYNRISRERLGEIIKDTNRYIYMYVYKTGISTIPTVKVEEVNSIFTEQMNNTNPYYTETLRTERLKFSSRERRKRVFNGRT